MESDLKTLSRHSLFCNHADDTNLLVPGNFAIGINEEFINIKNWATANKMIISLSKTKKIVFSRPGLRHFMNPLPINNFEQVDVVNLLCILLSNNFCFDEQVGNVLKMCSQQVYLLKVLREQGLSRGQLHTVFLALIVS